MRFHLGSADLARTTFAPATPYCELAVSVQVLQQPTSQFRRLWHGRRTPVPTRARPLQELIPAHGSVPTFLAPEGSSCLDEALDVVLSTPVSLIRQDLAEIRWAAAPSPWISDLAHGRLDALKELAVAMRAYHDHVLSPLWPIVQKVASAELQERAWQLAIEGFDVALNTLHPQITWQAGTLEVRGPGDAGLELEGRGLRLMPSVWTRPAVPVPWKQPTLVFPIRAASWLQQPAHDHHDRLAAVLGTTRAKVLRALAVEHSTSELARVVGISPASASSHAAALRGAGLVRTQRVGQAVRHALTDLGQAIASGDPFAFRS